MSFSNESAGWWRSTDDAGRNTTAASNPRFVHGNPSEGYNASVGRGATYHAPPNSNFVHGDQGGGYTANAGGGDPFSIPPS